MKRTLACGGALVGLLLLPEFAAACTCAWSEPPPPIAERSAVLIGTVLWVDRPAEPSDAEGARQQVKILTEVSWRTPLADTLSLLVGGNAPCAEYLAGGRYLVVADLQDGRLHTGQCDRARSLVHASVRRTVDSLGEPTWIAPSQGDRLIDASLVQVGDAPPATDSLI